MATDPPPRAPGTATPDDLYAALGLEPRATRDEIERAYRFCLELYGEGALATYSLLEPAEAEQQRNLVREAYEILGDAEKRRAYDAGHGFLPPAEGPLLAFPSVAAGQEQVEPEVPELLTGADLRRRRESRGMSLRHIASVTKIGLRFLEYIEQDRFDFLPAPVYLRGFLQEYARLVGLDPRRAADSYMRRLAAPQG
jgi:curved DNA-binding protein CbpA